MSRDGAFAVLDKFRTCPDRDSQTVLNEVRANLIAPLGEGPLHTVVFTEIDEERARIISLRPSTTQEVHTYATQKKGKK
jgi:uncharacterized DUF497 family protein